MATFQKRDDALRGYVSDIDVEQYGKVLIGLQAGYDKNVGELTKVDMQLKKIADTQLLNQEAKDYFFTRMRERKDVLEKNMGNFAHANELDYGMKTLYSAIDDTVATEIYNSSIPSTIQEQYKKLADGKNPQLANSVNLEYSMKDIGAWLNTKGHLGKRFQGNSTYVPHTDIMKEIDAQVKKAHPDAYAIATESGLQIKTTNGELLSPARVKEIVDMAKTANPAIAKQIEINGWNQFRGIDDNSFLLGAKSKISEIVANYEKSAEAETPYNTGAVMLGATPIAESAMRAKAYDKSAANFYKEILVGADGKSGLMSMNRIDAASREKLESLLAEEDLKSSAANSFAYNAVKKSDIKLNEAKAFEIKRNDDVSQFNLTYAQNQQKINQDQEKIDLEKLKIFKEANPNATIEDIQYSGLNANLYGQVFNPNTTMVDPSEVSKSEDLKETEAQIASMRTEQIPELKKLAYNIAILQGKTDVEAAEIKNYWDKSGKTQEEFDRNLVEHARGLADALKNKKDISPTEVKLIKEYHDRLSKLKRVLRTEKEYYSTNIDEKKPSKPSFRHGEIDSSRFAAIDKRGGLNLSEQIYRDNFTGEEVTSREASKRTQVPNNIDVEKYVKVSNGMYLNKENNELYYEQEAIRDSYSRKVPTQLISANNNLQSIASKNGLLLLASKGAAYTTKDVNLIADALRFTTDDELKKFGLADIKDIKESIKKALIDKDAKDFPISEMKVNKDGGIVLIKADGGNPVLINGYAPSSRLGQFASNKMQQQARQDEKLQKSVELIADADMKYNKDGALVRLESINGKQVRAQAYMAPLSSPGSRGEMYVKLTYIDENNVEKTELIEDNQGNTMFTVSDNDYNNVNLKTKIDEMLDTYISGLKLKSDKLKNQNGGK